ncbi:MAG: TonB-dependent receptor [Acidobacteriota bacterium]|nr:MAG: TonB-dependent receptor [Acidobacteriota bacterium]
MSFHGFRRIIGAFVCSMFLVIGAFAQDLDDVTISGRVTDANGLPVVGATVTATLVETSEKRSVVTDDDGRYRLIKLKPGTYKISAAASGFGTLETPPTPTVSAQNLLKDFKLSPADIREEMTVTVIEDDGPLVDTTRTIVGGTITEREIEELPNNTRNALDLVLTLGGTSEEQLSTSGLSDDRFQNSPTAPLEQGNFSLSGGVAYSNNLTIDGLDNNDDRSSRERFQPSLEGIAEVQVISNQFSAEYGRASGGRINIRTRAGSNRFRGRAFFFFRDDNLNANSWYNNSRGFSRQPLTEYNPGFFLSGPVRLPFYDGRRKTFFSVAYEYENVQDSTFIDTWLPVGSNPRFPLPQGNLQCPAGVTCNDPSSSPPTPILPYQAIVATPNLAHRLTARVDHNFSQRNNATFGYQFGRRANRRTTFQSTTRLDDALQVRNIDTDAFNFTNNHVFSARAVNQIRGQYSIYEPSFQTDNATGPVVLISYQNPQFGGTQTLIAGNSTAAITGDATGFPQNRRETRIQIQDSLTYLAGRHSLKMGFDIMRVRSKALGLGDATGTFNFTGILNFQNNVLSRYRQNYGTRSDVINTYWGVFFNDEFKIKSNLTLSFGVRYERETAVTDNNNIGPRIGVAWDPFKKGRGVIRAGAGIFYNRVLLRTVADSIQNTGGNLVSFDTNLIGTAATDPRRVAILNAIAQNFPNAFATPDDIRALLTSVCPTVVNPPAPCTTSTGFRDSVTSTGNPLRTVDPNLVIPESYQYNIGFEREINRDWLFEANFTVNKTVHLWRDTNGNKARLPAGFADWTQWLLANSFQLTNQNGTIRNYTFTLGSTTDTSGVSTCSFTTNNTCVVNLNTTNTSTTAPAAASTGNNNNATGGPIGIARAAIAQFRPNPNFGEQSVIRSIGNAYYQGLVLELRRRYRPLGAGFGSSLRFVYTLSSTKDDGLNNTSNAQIDGDFDSEWARSRQDRRHRIAFTGTFDTPWWMGKLRFSPLVRWGSSAPFSLGNGGSDRNLDDNSTDRPNFAGNLSDIKWRPPGSPIPTALIAQFSLPPIGARGGNLPRNVGTGPSFYTFDLNITREFRFKERYRIRPVAQFDNILNAAVFAYGAGFIDFSGLAQVGNVAAQQAFLVPTRTYRQRQIRLGMRFDF